MPAAYSDSIALQLYSVREQLARDPGATLTAVRDAGYTHVELVSTTQLHALSPHVRALGLAVRASAYPWEALRDGSLGQHIEAAAAAGLREVVFPYLPTAERTSPDDYRRLADELNRAGELADAAGLRHLYHHHSFEFAPLDAAGTRGWDLLLERLDPAHTGFELDVFWLQLAGEDPAAALRQLRGRVPLLHLKDLHDGHGATYDEAAVAPEAFARLGTGVLPLTDYLDAAVAAGVEQLVVEQDASPDPLADAAASLRYLRGLLALGPQAASGLDLRHLAGEYDLADAREREELRGLLVLAARELTREADLVAGAVATSDGALIARRAHKLTTTLRVLRVDGLRQAFEAASSASGAARASTLPEALRAAGRACGHVASRL